MKMLFATATLFLVYATLDAGKPPHEFPPELKAAHDACMKKLDKTLEQLMEEKKNGDNEKRDCFGACVFKERGIMTADGDWDKETASKKFPPHVTEEIAKKILETCFEKKGADECESAAITRDCIKSLLPHPPFPPHIKKIVDECKANLESTQEEIDTSISSEDNYNKGCLIACIAKGMGFMTEDGDLIKDKFIEHMSMRVPKETLEKAFEACNDIRRADQCETIIAQRKCFKENGVSFGIHNGPPREF